MKGITHIFLRRTRTTAFLRIQIQISVPSLSISLFLFNLRTSSPHASKHKAKSILHFPPFFSFFFFLFLFLFSFFPLFLPPFLPPLLNIHPPSPGSIFISHQNEKDQYHYQQINKQTFYILTVESRDAERR